MSVRLRPVRDADRDWLLRWRNEPSVWAYGMTRRKVSVKEHANWFTRLDRARAFIILRDGAPAGHVRADPDVTIFVIPECRGLGVALRALRLYARRFTPLRAYVHPLNIASVNLFARAGFRYLGVSPDTYLAFGWGV